MDEKDVIKSCPNNEILEEYRDGTVSGEWMAHIDNCKSCQRRIASLDLLDLRIRSICQPSDKMADRIKAAVHEGREPSIKSVPIWRSSLFRISASAAVLMLLLSISLYIIREGGEGSRSTETVVNDSGFAAEADGPHERTAAEPEQITIAQNRTPMQENANAAPTPSKLSFNSNLRLAGTLGEGVSAKRKLVQKQPLGEAVRHIWSVKDQGEAREFILKVVKANDKNVEIEQGEGGFRALIELKDTELQQLVDMLNGNGWRLVSPYIPQPGEADAIEFMNTPVIYNVNVVEDGK